MAKKLTRKEKGEQINRRFEVIKSLMSSFAVGTVAIIAAVVFIPSSPKANIIETVALIDTVTYQVNVTDEDHALDLSTLVVVLENQFEYYETPISLGESTGYFDNLKPNTDYWLNVYGSKGYGKERLDSAIVKTRDRIGGYILSVEHMQFDFETSYIVDVLINDPDDLYQSVNLYYGYPNEWEPDQPIVYEFVAIQNSHEQIELFDIFTNEPFHIYLEAVTAEGTVLLDDVWVTPPFDIHSSMYLNRINDDAIYFTLYDDIQEGLEIDYQVRAYIGDVLIKAVDVDIGSTAHEQEIGITGLSPGKQYLIEGIATYVNPQTLREESVVIYEEEITTLASYSMDYRIEYIDNQIEVTLSVIDPNHYFQIPYIDIYEIIDGQDVWISSETFTFTQNGNEKTVTMSVPITTSHDLHLIFGMKNDIDFTINHQIDSVHLSDETNE